MAGLKRTSSAAGELTRDEILDNITLYWLTNTGVSSSRLYWEYKGGFFNAKGVKIPVAVTVFPSEQYQAPRSWTERAYPKLIYYNQVAQGRALRRLGAADDFSSRNCAPRSSRCAETSHDTQSVLTVASAHALLVVGSGSPLAPRQPRPAGTTRTDLQRHDLSIPGREVLQARVDFAPGASFPAAHASGRGDHLRPPRHARI